MTLKNSGNKRPQSKTVDCYVATRAVLAKSENEDELVVALAVGKALRKALRQDENETDAIMQSLSRIEAAAKRMRAEMRAIHG